MPFINYIILYDVQIKDELKLYNKKPSLKKFKEGQTLKFILEIKNSTYHVPEEIGRS